MRDFFVGILIGSGAILPGISSGVFCVAFGLYEKIIYAITNFFKDIKKNFLFLFPIVLGSIIGIFVCGNILKFLFNTFKLPTSFAFIGLILGSINLVFKQIKTHRIGFLHILCTILTFSFSVYLIALENSSLKSSLFYTNNSFLILTGVLMSAGIVIPGISKTVILMMLGMYELYLNAITSFNLSILLPIGLGLAIGGIIFLVVLQFLFKYLNSYTYFGIIGFVLGSVFVLYPGFNFNLEGIISVLLFIITFFITIRIK